MEQVYSKLEYDLVCAEIAKLSHSSVVSDAIMQMRPVNNLQDAEKLLSLTSEALIVLKNHRVDIAFDSVLALTEKARVGAILQPYELLTVNNTSRMLRVLKNCVENTEDCDGLKDIVLPVRVCAELEKQINQAVENETDLKDSASEKLYSLRKAISRANSKLKERLDSYTRKSEVSKYLQDNIITLRGGRYVIPVKSECRSNVKGLVHDISSTGATAFIEPFEIVEANNELRTLKTDEQNEVQRILQELSKAVAQNAYELSEAQYALTECGVIFAKAEYAKKTDSFCPILNDFGIIKLFSARHPLISVDTVVPIDISMEKSLLLISGPNTGGKTVALKTIGLFCLMAASGILIPAAENSEVCIFESVYCDIGDAQSIAQSLSTFSAHIKNISQITTNIDNRSLVLLDEVGDGTDPEEGAALAIAIIKKLIDSGCRAVVTTHFNSVKEFAITRDDIENACMQFDTVNFKPTYRVISGTTGSSYALEIAESLGLDEGIIKDAKSALSAEKVAVDKIIREAEKIRNDALAEKTRCEKLRAKAEEDEKRAEKLRREYEQKLGELNDNSRAMIRAKSEEYVEKAEQIIAELKECLKNANESALFEARKIAKELRNGVPVDTKKPTQSGSPASAEQLSNGTRVYVAGLNKEGIVFGRPRGDKVVVAIGSVKTELPIGSLSVISPEKVAKKQSVRHVAEPENREIMLLGMTVDEAVEVIERTLSDLPPHSTLRIVHGKGTGALGRGIQNYLKKHAKIKAFRYGRYGEGDSGVTIVELK